MVLTEELPPQYIAITLIAVNSGGYYRVIFGNTCCDTSVDIFSDLITQTVDIHYQ